MNRPCGRQGWGQTRWACRPTPEPGQGARDGAREHRRQTRRLNVESRCWFRKAQGTRAKKPAVKIINRLALPGHGPFGERCQMLLVDAIDLGLHLGVPAQPTQRVVRGRRFFAGMTDPIEKSTSVIVA